MRKIKETLDFQDEIACPAGTSMTSYFLAPPLKDNDCLPLFMRNYSLQSTDAAFFLIAKSHSIRGFGRPSVRLSVCPSVRPSVRPFKKIRDISKLVAGCRPCHAKSGCFWLISPTF